ncbi:MAG: phosphopantetheine-binding protein [Burkholderiaceae bacterium]|jgi:acyl carrier protein|nr:phosphopantetheine-binding protein [Burkholderiaceae bacterium]
MTERPTSAAEPDHAASEREAMREAIYASLRSVAPEFDPSSIDGRRPLRDEADIDSFDFLNLLIDLQARTGIEVPEADYARVGTLDAMLAYLLERRGTDDASSTAAA